MSFTTDQTTGDIIVNGFQNGIAESPYSGITDIRNMNLISVPGEASINFSTSQTSSVSASGTMTSSSGTTLTLSNITNLDNGMAIYFTGLSDASKGLSNNTPYWMGDLSGLTIKVYSDYSKTAVITTTASLTGTWASYNMATPKYFTTNNNANYYLVDSEGKVWSNTETTTTNTYWTYTGNDHVDNAHVPNTDPNASGNGIVYYQSSNSDGYVFVFRNATIDYFKVNALAIAWVYGWNYMNSSPNNAQGTASGFKTPVGTLNPHEALLAPDNRVYFCDANWIGSFYETSAGTPFDPSVLATYTPAQFNILPSSDTAQCLAWLGTNILIGGIFNVVYPWDRSSIHFSYPILLAERNIVKMVTVNTNTYCFVGNRGRIYITNGSQAQLWKKVPDHLSLTVEPYFTWRGVTSIKNQIYFSFTVTKNDTAVYINNYSGLWAVDVDTKALRMTNTLSYGAGSTTNPSGAYALIPIADLNKNPAGGGLYIGWASGASGIYGIDKTISTVYTGGEAYVISDMIPIGTLLKPSTSKQLEYKLATPLLATETIELQVGSYLGGAFTSAGTTTGSASATILSDNFPLPVQAQQWLLVKVISTGKASNPSYNRLTELRIIQR